MRLLERVGAGIIFLFSTVSLAQIVYPYSASYSGSTPMWSLTNTGSGATANFINTSSTTPTMTVWNNSTSRAISASSQGMVGDFQYGGGNGFLLTGNPAASGTGIEVMHQCLPPLVGPCLGGFYKSYGDFAAIGLKANSGIAIQGIGFASLASVGVEGQGGTAVKAVASPASGVGVLAQAQSGAAVLASCTTGNAVYATSTSGTAVTAVSSSGGVGLLATATSHNAVQAFSTAGTLSAIYASASSANTGNGVTGSSIARNPL